MYHQRRCDHYWLRKATPLDLIHVLGQAEVRCSLRTDRRDVAKRRARALLVALDNVYAVLGSEEPQEPAKILLGNFAQDFVKQAAGTPEGIQVAHLQLQRELPTLSEHLPCRLTTSTTERGSTSTTLSRYSRGNNRVPMRTLPQPSSCGSPYV